MAGTYLVLGLMLTGIPFFGGLVFVLVSPLLLGGALLAAQALASDAPEQAPLSYPWWEIWLLRPLRALLLVLGDAHQTFRILVTSVLVLGLVLASAIVEYLLTGGSVLSGLAAGDLAAPMKTARIVGISIAMLLRVVLFMALLYLVPLTVLGTRPPFAALAEGFRTCTRHALPLAIFASGFVLVAMALSALVVLSSAVWLNYLAVLIVGAFVLPRFVAGIYCSYRALFPSSP